jgi:5-methylcytosine-specific restriction protein B
MAERSKELIKVGYYLSRFGMFNPPSRFGNIKWNEVYRMFFEKLGHGRQILEFEHSLKNTRDGFDGYFPETKREGWKDKNGNPAKLSLADKEVFDQFQSLTEEEIFNRIEIHLSISDSTKDTIIHSFNFISSETRLSFNKELLKRFTSSLLTKPFVILTGLSGSGKTKLAQAFAMWMSANKEQYALVPVGADWTNREPLLGYPNSLKANHYVKPDMGVLDILLRAHENYMANEKDLAKCIPYFLILDEMNLSHVERYFADFLSTMESGDEIKLYSGSTRYAELDADGHAILGTEIPDKIILPKNLFIIGTVNIDETTYMFSPKVLDRANTIEFRITQEEMQAFYQNNKPLNMDALLAQGKDQAPAFMALAAGSNLKTDRSKHKDTFVAFFEALQAAGAEFGYRTATEMTKLVSYLMHFGMSETEAYDVAIMQKLLPKLHGSRSKLNKVLPILISLCNHKYPISLEKLERMKKNAEDNGFASYAEA